MDTPQIPTNVASLGIHKIIAFDMETFYSTSEGYSLSKMTTEEYVRDSRFQVICMTATVDGETVYRAWGAQDCIDLLRRLGAEQPGVMCLAHNARFDGTVGEMALGVRFNMLVCTMHLMRITGLSRVIGESLSALSDFLRRKNYPLPPKGTAVADANGLRLEHMSQAFKKTYGDYCQDDTIITFRAAMILLPLCPPDTLRASHMSLTMYTRPMIELDLPLLEDYLATLVKRREMMLANMAMERGCESVDAFLSLLRSKPKFAVLLRELGVEPPTKISLKKTETKKKNAADEAWLAKNKTPAFLAQLAEEGKSWEEWVEAPVMDYALAMKDVEFAELLNHHDERVVALVNARMENNASQEESRTKRFIAIAKRGRLVFPLQYASARTHRYTADDALNMQNLSKHKGEKKLRYSMRAPEGYLVGGADSSQVEARCLAYAAQETRLINIFATGGDPYSYMAETIYNVPAAEVKRYAKMDTHGLEGDELAKQKLYSFMRFIGKRGILGLGYSMSGGKFALTLRSDGITLNPTKEQQKAWLAGRPKMLLNDRPALSLAYREYLESFHDKESARICRLYRKQHSHIEGFWKTCDWALAKMCQGEEGYFGGPNGMLFHFDGNHRVLGEKTPGVELPNGEWLVYPGLESFIDEDTGYTKYRFYERKGRATITKYIYGGSLTENLIQALAFTILTWQGVRVNSVVPVKGNVHDEWISIFPWHLRDRVQKVYETAMRAVPPFVPGLPLDCEFSAGPTYGDM